MRTAIILLLVTVLCVTTTHAQNIPNNIKGAFMKLHPNAKGVKWENEDGKYEATYKQDGHKISILFNSNATVEETETSISVKDLPTKALKYASAKGEIEEAAKTVSSDGTITYEAEVDDTDLIFDANGNFIKSKKNKEDNHDHEEEDDSHEDDED
ncbi:MAG: hypothetical protein R2800_03420 [Flavipsychrobacter sp.]